MEVKPKIAWLSDGAQLTTGYSTISRKLLNYLVDYGWDAHYLSHTGPHQTFKPGVTLEDDEVFKFTLHGSANQPYYQDLLASKLKEVNPNIFGILLDTFMLNPPGNPWFFNMDFAPAKSLFYFPSDGGGTMKDGQLIKGLGCRLPLTCENILRKVDKPVAMSMFAKQQVKEVHGIHADYIPHAVETDIYKPLSEQDRQLIKKAWGLQDKFVIGVVARNQGRKMLDRTLLMMKYLKDKIPNAILFLHSDKYDPATYFNADVRTIDLEIQNRVIWSGVRYFKGFDYRKMNEIYNLFDVFCLGTSGEGFGIPTIEAMSAEIPVLATDYTTTWELVERNNAGESIKVSDEILGSWEVGRALVDSKDMADKIYKLYKDENLRKEYGKNGRRAVLKDYDWKYVSKEWDKLLRGML